MAEDSSTASASRVAAAVVSWFDGSRVAQKKHLATEWTVLAGLVLRVGDEIRVLATGTGTKCLGQRDLDADGLVVNDCHAEVVARRALLRYLYTEALQWVHGESVEHSIFERASETQKLRLRPGHELHLYISEAPCGDAAIYPLKEAVVDALVEQRTQREASGDGERSELRLTGAKQKRSDDADEKQDKRFEQAVGIARVKSGRSDLPQDKQTLSMSCSDKIARWNVVGVQGSLLLRWFEPLFLTSVVVAEDPASHSRAAQLRAMERALRDRVHSQHVSLSVVEAETFSRARDSTKAASPLSLNWTRREPRWRQPQDKATKSWKSLFFQSPDLEVLMGATGFKEGAKKASKMDATAKQRVASRLSKWSFFRAYDELCQAERHDTAPEAAQLLTYVEEKTRVLTSSDVALRERVKKDLGAWVGVPTTYKSFSLSTS